MAEQVLLEQAFWGSDKDGYHVLAISDPGSKDIVDKICYSVGTPDGFSEIKPFLISRLEGDKIFMVCARNGSPDASHRKTLFFHVLFGSRAICDSLNITAFSLFHNGLFVAAPTSDCRPVAVGRLQPAADLRKPFDWDEGDLAIVSKTPQNDLIENLVGKNANRFSWATFSFADLPQYRLFAISEFVLKPNTRICRSTGGEILFKPSSAPVDPLVQNTERPAPPRRIWPTILLVISLLLNLFLLVYVMQTGKYTAGKIQPEVAPGSVRKPGPSEDEVRQKLIARWSADFPVGSRIPDWDAEMGKYPILKDKSTDPTVGEYAVFLKLRRYVDFVNHHILNIPNKEK